MTLLAPKYLDLPPLHPDSASVLYTVCLAKRHIHNAEVTAASWSVTGGATLGTSSFTNPGDSAHTIIEARDEREYDGPLVSTYVSAGTAADGDTLYLTCEYTTDLVEGPRHFECRIQVTDKGY